MTDFQSKLLNNPHSRYFASTNYSQLIMKEAELAIEKRKKEFMHFFDECVRIKANYSAYQKIIKLSNQSITNNNLLPSVQEILQYPSNKRSQAVGELDENLSLSAKVSESMNNMITQIENNAAELKSRSKTMKKLDSSSIPKCKSPKDIITAELKQIYSTETEIENEFVQSLDISQIEAMQNENQEFQDLF